MTQPCRGVWAGARGEGARPGGSPPPGSAGLSAWRRGGFPPPQARCPAGGVASRRRTNRRRPQLREANGGVVGGERVRAGTGPLGGGGEGGPGIQQGGDPSEPGPRPLGGRPQLWARLGRGRLRGPTSLWTPAPRPGPAPSPTPCREPPPPPPLPAGGDRREQRGWGRWKLLAGIPPGFLQGVASEPPSGGTFPKVVPPAPHLCCCAPSPPPRQAGPKATSSHCVEVLVGHSLPLPPCSPGAPPQHPSVPSLWLVFFPLFTLPLSS